MNEFTFKDILSFYDEKFNDGSVFMVQKSLTYFEDANFQLQPQMFLDFDWEICKQKIIEEVIKL